MADIWMDVDTALSEVPVNIMPLVDDTDFKTIEDAVAYNAAGMDLTWNFSTTGGAFTSTAVTPTTGGDYDWAEHTADDGMYTIEIPASGGASINNDTEGFGWFTGVATGVAPWRGPVIGFRAADANNALIDAWSATRGAAGTALPAVAADGAGGLPISDAGGLDLDTKLAATDEITAARMGALTDWIEDGRLDAILDLILADTAELQGDDVPGLIAALNNVSTAEVNAQCDTAISDALDSIADAVHDEVVAGTTTLRQMCRGFAAVLLGKASGLATTTAVFRDIADSMNVVSATVDTSGNRSTVSLDLDDTP